MPTINISDISGGIRKLPARLAPANSVKSAKNVIPNIDRWAFISASVLEQSFVANNSYNVFDASYIGINGVQKLFYAQLNSSNYAEVRDKSGGDALIGTVTDIDTSSERPLMLEESRGGVVVHNNKTDTLAVRYLYNYLKINQFYSEAEGVAFRQVPDIGSTDLAFPIIASVSPALVISILNFASTVDDVPYLVSVNGGTKYRAKVGLRFDGHQSIAWEAVDFSSTETGGSVTEAGIAVTITCSESKMTGERETGVDVYLTEGYRAEDQQNWFYVGYVPFDSNVQLTDSLSGTISGNVVTVSGKSWGTNQWAYCMMYDSGTNDYYPILSSTADTITLRSGHGLTGSLTIKMYSRWWEDESVSGKWYYTHYLTRSEGESIYARTGLDIRKIANSYDYCPPAYHMAYFKGRMWLGDYKEYGNTRRRNRLIWSVVNSDGLVCEDVYNVEEYIELPGSIRALKPSEDYMYVFTDVGIYSIRFSPATELGITWIVKKISNMVLPHRKLAVTSQRAAYFFNYQHLYAIEHDFVKLLTNEELSDVFEDYITAANKNSDKYAIHFDESSEAIYLFLDSVLRVKGGIFEHEDAPISNANYVVPRNRDEENSSVFLNYTNYKIKDITESTSVIFSVEAFDNDFGTKEDKYFNKGSALVYKSIDTNVYIEIYLDNSLFIQHILVDNTPYVNEYIDLVPPKSKSRRFTRLRWKIYANAADSFFKLGTLDLDIDGVPRTLIGE